METLALLIGSVAGTTFISGVLSVGGGTILMGIFGWVLPISQAMILHGITQMASNGSRALLNRRHIEWSVLRGYFLGSAVCLSVLLWFFFVPNKILLFLLLGLMPFVNFLLPRGKALDITKPWMPTLCGVLTTGCLISSGVSGPLLDVFYVKTSLTRYQIHATKGLTQTFGHIIKIGYFISVIELANTEGSYLPWWVYVAVVPVAFAGTWVARHVLHLISDAHFRALTQGATMAIGVVFLSRAATLMLAG
jgi:uncharacterized membrane protein YfcA